MDIDADQIAAVRSVHRRYRRVIGVLREGLHNSPFPLPEARVLYEIFQHPGILAGDLGRLLGMDQGYVSRTIARLGDLGLIDRVRSEADGRQWHLFLSGDGREA